MARRDRPSALPSMSSSAITLTVGGVPFPSVTTIDYRPDTLIVPPQLAEYAQRLFDAERMVGLTADQSFANSYGSQPLTMEALHGSIETIRRRNDWGDATTFSLAQLAGEPLPETPTAPTTPERPRQKCTRWLEID